MAVVRHGTQSAAAPPVPVVPLEVVEPDPVAVVVVTVVPLEVGAPPVPVVPLEVVDPGPVVPEDVGAPPVPVLAPELQEAARATQALEAKRWRRRVLGPRNFMARHRRVTYLQPQAQAGRSPWGTM